MNRRTFIGSMLAVLAAPLAMMGLSRSHDHKRPVASLQRTGLTLNDDIFGANQECLSAGQQYSAIIRGREDFLHKIAINPTYSTLTSERGYVGMV